LCESSRQIITSKRPFEDLSPWLIPAAVVERAQRPLIPDWVPAPFAELVRACWHPEPAKRPSARQALEWLQVVLERAPLDDSWPSQ
jgi:DNA-binding transcriptional LysR family regulator